jgi:hypothetical protein
MKCLGAATGLRRITRATAAPRDAGDGAQSNGFIDASFWPRRIEIVRAAPGVLLLGP